MHLTFDYDYLRSETDFTEMEELEEMEGRKEWLRTGSVPSPLRDAMMSSSPNNLPSSVIFLVLVAAVAGKKTIHFVINFLEHDMNLQYDMIIIQFSHISGGANTVGSDRDVCDEAKVIIQIYIFFYNFNF